MIVQGVITVVCVLLVVPLIAPRSLRLRFWPFDSLQADNVARCSQAGTFQAFQMALRRAQFHRKAPGFALRWICIACVLVAFETFAPTAFDYSALEIARITPVQLEHWKEQVEAQHSRWIMDGDLERAAELNRAVGIQAVGQAEAEDNKLKLTSFSAPDSENYVKVEVAKQFAAGLNNVRFFPANATYNTIASDFDKGLSLLVGSASSAAQRTVE